MYPAVVGGAYAALTMLLSPLSFGAVQCRLSEALCVLPFFLPETAWGLALGCFLANTLSAAGLPDMVFGSLATLLAGLITASLGRRWGRRDKPPLSLRLAVCAVPVVVNALIVGAVLAAVLGSGAFLPVFALMAVQVAAGEALSVFSLGLPLMGVMPRIMAALPRE